MFVVVSDSKVLVIFFLLFASRCICSSRICGLVFTLRSKSGSDKSAKEVPA